MKYLNTQSYIECIKKSKILEVISYDPIRPSCNNRCKFCITADCTIPPQPVEELHLANTLQYKWIKDTIIPQLIENDLLDIKCNFQMIGGELFYLPEKYYDEYYNWLETGWNLLNPILKKKPIVNLFTNLLFPKDTAYRFIDLYEKIGKLIGKHPNICTSFDLWGRFNTEDSLNNWLSTTNLLKSQLKEGEKIGIETLLITPSIKEYLLYPNSEISKLFDKLLEDPTYRITLQEYVPNSEEQVKELIPNKELILQFFDRIKKLHPDCGMIKAYKVENLKIPKPTYYYNNCHALTFNVPGWTQPPYHHKCMEDGSIPIDSCIYTQYHNMPNFDINRDFDEDLPKSGIICIDQPKLVDKYFNKTLHCDFCKYGNVCNRYCMGIMTLKYTTKECWKKLVYDLIND